MNYIEADMNETIWDVCTTKIHVPSWDELIEANTSALNNLATTTSAINNWATTVPTEINKIFNYKRTWKPAEDFFEYYELDDDILKSVIKNWKEVEDGCELEKDNFELPNIEELIS